MLERSIYSYFDKKMKTLKTSENDENRRVFDSVEIFEKLYILYFKGIYLKISNSKSRFSIINLRKKEQICSQKPSEVKLRKRLTCPSLLKENFRQDACHFTLS